MPASDRRHEGGAQALLVELLADQPALTAVEQFSLFHESKSGAANSHAIHYRELLPLSSPKAGEQYAFEVDLDACSGCKACVTACHNLNGLEERELWRQVGLLSGGTNEAPVIQHVTSACHHCLEPACLHGCPVNAYEKDPQTGIVRHLDDQCIGCQYCILKCPYDVPKYSAAKGIVRKCDMCQQRLAVGEAPACVQSCPNQAIRITVVSRQAVRDECETNLFLPGAPEPGYTLPTTVYKSARSLPRNLLPADYYSARPSHAHWPLVLMLVLTQMSVGAYALEWMLRSSSSLAGAIAAEPSVHAAHAAVAWLLGMLGLLASIFHLGRPLYAFRAILGLRTSWLSREIAAFGAFAAAATLAAGLSIWPLVSGGEASQWESGASGLAASFGLAGVFCSVMIYVDTRRPYWRFDVTSARFFLTAVVLGAAVVELLSLLAATLSSALDFAMVQTGWGRWLNSLLVLGMAVKLVCEASVLLRLFDHQHTPLRRTAMLLVGELRPAAVARMVYGLLGGIVLPALLLSEDVLAPRGYPAGLTLFLAVGSLAATLFGELRERYLFFTAVVSPKMPGSLAT